MRERLYQFALSQAWLRPWARYLHPDQEWTGAKNWLMSMVLLMVALVAALNGAAAFERGLRAEAAILHTFALSICFFVAVKFVPQMAAGTPLKWLFYQVDYKLTREGIVYLVAVFVISLAALNTGNNLLFIVVASLLAGIVVSGAVSRMVLTGIELNLELPDHVFARQPVLASLSLTNLKLTLPSFSLLVGDESANGKRRRKKKAAGQATDDRRVLNQPVYFPYIGRNKQAAQQVELTFPRRGRYAQDAFHLSSKFPFGFLLKTRKLTAASELVVYPPVEPTEEFYEILPLISGEMESYYRGRGHDLYTIRDHQPGDGARYLDWKATAKSQALKVREFTREDERRVELVFDSYVPTGAEAEERFERGVTFCACLAWHFHEIDAQLKFRSQDWSTPVASAGEIIFDVLRYLALVEPRRSGDGAFLASLGAETDTFKIILTAQPRGSIPTNLWTSSYFVFMDSL